MGAIRLLVVGIRNNDYHSYPVEKHSEIYLDRSG